MFSTLLKVIMHMFELYFCIMKFSWKISVSVYEIVVAQAVARRTTNQDGSDSNPNEDAGEFSSALPCALKCTQSVFHARCTYVYRCEVYSAVLYPDVDC